MWHHISGTLNPSDVQSKKYSIEQLIELKWFEGPGCLDEKEEKRRKSIDVPNEDFLNSEIRKIIAVTWIKNYDQFKWYYKYFFSKM